MLIAYNHISTVHSSVNTKGLRNKVHSVIEVELPETATDRLDPLIDLLAELLARERIRELETMKADDTL